MVDVFKDIVGQIDNRDPRSSRNMKIIMPVKATVNFNGIAVVNVITVDGQVQGPGGIISTAISWEFAIMINIERIHLIVDGIHIIDGDRSVSSHCQLCFCSITATFVGVGYDTRQI